MARRSTRSSAASAPLSPEPEHHHQDEHNNLNAKNGTTLEVKQEIVGASLREQEEDQVTPAAEDGEEVEVVEESPPSIGAGVTPFAFPGLLASTSFTGSHPSFAHNILNDLAHEPMEEDEHHSFVDASSVEPESRAATLPPPPLALPTTTSSRPSSGASSTRGRTTFSGVQVPPKGDHLIASGSRRGSLKDEEARAKKVIEAEENGEGTPEVEPEVEMDVAVEITSGTVRGKGKGRSSVGSAKSGRRRSTAAASAARRKKKSSLGNEVDQVEEPEQASESTSITSPAVPPQLSTLSSLSQAPSPPASSPLSSPPESEAESESSLTTQPLKLSLSPDRPPNGAAWVSPEEVEESSERSRRGKGRVSYVERGESSTDWDREECEHSVEVEEKEAKGKGKEKHKPGPIKPSSNPKPTKSSSSPRRVRSLTPFAAIASTSSSSSTSSFAIPIVTTLEPAKPKPNPKKRGRSSKASTALENDGEAGPSSSVVDREDSRPSPDLFGEAVEVVPPPKKKRQKTYSSKKPVEAEKKVEVKEIDVEKKVPRSMEEVPAPTPMEEDVTMAEVAIASVDKGEAADEDDDEDDDEEDVPLANSAPRPPSPRKTRSRSRHLSTQPEVDDLPPFYVIQQTRCQSKFIQHDHPRCHQCVSRYKDSKCAFEGVRSFQVDPVSGKFLRPFFFSTNREPETPEFPTEFNEPFTKSIAEIIKTAAANHILSTLEEELEHARKEQSIRLRSELSTRSTCDTCLTTIMAGSWLCTGCGRELCFDCFEKLKGLVGKSLSGLKQEHDKRLAKCVPTGGAHSREVHKEEMFLPVTREKLEVLEKEVKAMREWRETHKDLLEKKVEIDEKTLKSYYAEGMERMEEDEGHPYLVVPAKDLAPKFLVDNFDSDNDDNPRFSFTSTSNKPDQAHRISEVERLNDQEKERVKEYFGALWAKGETMVVDLGNGKSWSLDWTPEDFVKRYGKQACKIESNRTGKLTDSTIGEFFEKFGKENRDGDSQKIKDWPSETDFRTAFPPLYHDFQSAIPCPHVTRRDAVLNIAAHTPSNANPPDLGPKGYFSHVSDDSPGGHGSTKLHMDVADAVNLMLWAGNDRDGNPGKAAWDLFRAEDSDTIRDFLYGLISETDAKGRSLEEIKAVTDDPIHGQTFFLDSHLRERLWKEKGVKSWRIWQVPGQVVFIPAGCAHQVCNFADCIKIASDFVSIENIPRCWTVTDEFRAQTKSKSVWRNDILQLKSQLLWAWRSCERFEF